MHCSYVSRARQNGRFTFSDTFSARCQFTIHRSDCDMGLRAEIVDFRRFGLGVAAPGLHGSDEEAAPSLRGSDEEAAMAEQIVSALEKTGFLCLVNHGVPPEQIELNQKLSRAFFALPSQIKAKYKYEKNYLGYLGLEEEQFDLGKPRDLKECLNVGRHNIELFPSDEDVPHFREETLKFIATLEKLAKRILRLLGLGLKLENPDLFLEHHTFDEDICDAQIRMNLYPAPKTCTVKPGQLRIGPHMDSSTFSIVFSEGGGGYQVQTTDGSFAPVWTGPPDSAFINVGEPLQRWTSGRIKAPVHRVVVPTEDPDVSVTRQSIVFFALPDADKLVGSLDGDPRYPPVLPRQFGMEYFQHTGSFKMTDDKTNL